MIDENYYPQYDGDRSQPHTLIIVYDPPEINVVPHYSRSFVPSVNPHEYQEQYGDELLDIDALLDWCRRLNIPEDVVAFQTM